MILETLVITLGLIHFGIPLVYYIYLKRHLDDPWNLKIDSNFKPNIQIILPTHNEASRIKKRLDNLCKQKYPKDKIKVTVVDSASTDGTAEIAEDWASRNTEVSVKILKESERRGTLPALNHALDNASEEGETDLTVFTDADSEWEPNALKNGTKYFSDISVGAATCCIYPQQQESKGTEEAYRGFYNKVRVAESKVWGTPVASLPFLAIRRDLLEEMGGIPSWGTDDSTPASIVAFMGYRAIAAPDVIVREEVPDSTGRRVIRRVRRAQHLLNHFLHTEKKAGEKGFEYSSPFKSIFKTEKFLHLINPWILAGAFLLLILSFVYNPFFVGAISAMTAIALTLSGTFRSWILNQAILILASLGNLLGREFGDVFMWKQGKSVNNIREIGNKR